MGSDGKKKETDDSDTESARNSNATAHDPDVASDSEGKISRQPSQASCYATEDDEDLNIQLGPKWSIREHLEKDKVHYITLIRCS